MICGAATGLLVCQVFPRHAAAHAPWLLGHDVRTGSRWLSRVLTKIQRRSPVRVKANRPASLLPCRRRDRWPGSSWMTSASPSSQMITAPAVRTARPGPPHSHQRLGSGPRPVWQAAEHRDPATAPWEPPTTAGSRRPRRPRAGLCTGRAAPSGSGRRAAQLLAAGGTQRQRPVVPAGSRHHRQKRAERRAEPGCLVQPPITASISLSSSSSTVAGPSVTAVRAPACRISSWGFASASAIRE